MDVEFDTLSEQLSQKILQKIPLVVSDYAIDYPFTMAANNSSTDFAQVISDSIRFW